MYLRVGEMRGRDQLAVSVSLRWFPVSKLRKSVSLCVSVCGIYLHSMHVCSYMCLEVV